MEDIYYEYASAYVFFYNILLNQKKEGKLDENQLENIKNALDGFTKRKDDIIAK